MEHYFIKRSTRNVRQVQSRYSARCDGKSKIEGVCKSEFYEIKINKEGILMYIQFGECFCKGIQLNEYDVIIITNNSGGKNFLLQKMSDHRGTVTEISFPETAEMVAAIHNLMNDGAKYRKLRS